MLINVAVCTIYMWQYPLIPRPAPVGMGVGNGTPRIVKELPVEFQSNNVAFGAKIASTEPFAHASRWCSVGHGKDIIAKINQD